MRFKSRKDKLFQILTFGFCAFFGGIVLARTISKGTINYEFLWIDILMILVVGLILWLNFGTEYELTQTELKYKSGPINSWKNRNRKN